MRQSFTGMSPSFWHCTACNLHGRNQTDHIPAYQRGSMIHLPPYPTSEALNYCCYGMHGGSCRRTFGESQCGFPASPLLSGKCDRLRHSRGNDSCRTLYFPDPRGQDRDFAFQVLLQQLLYVFITAEIIQCLRRHSCKHQHLHHLLRRGLPCCRT